MRNIPFNSIFKRRPISIYILLIFIPNILFAQKKNNIDISSSIGGGFFYDTSVYLLGINYSARYHYNISPNFKIGIISSKGIFTSHEDKFMPTYNYGLSFKYRIKRLKVINVGLQYFLSNSASDTSFINYISNWPIYNYINTSIGLELPLKNNFYFLVETGRSFIVFIDRKKYNDIQNSFLVGMQYKF